jgi:hypothetical protein
MTAETCKGRSDGDGKGNCDGNGKGNVNAIAAATATTKQAPPLRCGMTTSCGMTTKGAPGK